MPPATWSCPLSSSSSSPGRGLESGCTQDLCSSLVQASPEIRACVDACNHIAKTIQEQNEFDSVSLSPGGGGSCGPRGHVGGPQQGSACIRVQNKQEWGGEKQGRDFGSERGQQSHGVCLHCSSHLRQGVPKPNPGTPAPTQSPSACERMRAALVLPFPVWGMGKGSPGCPA